MNAKNKISRSVLKVNCTYTIEDTVRFASMDLFPSSVHYSIKPYRTLHPTDKQKKRHIPPRNTPQSKKKHTYKLLLLAYLIYLPTHLPISNEQEQKHDPIALLFSSLLFPSPSPPRPQPKSSQTKLKPQKLLCLLLLLPAISSSASMHSAHSSRRNSPLRNNMEMSREVLV